eukprot:2862721-Rhodomonas_salina.1
MEGGWKEGFRTERWQAGLLGGKRRRRNGACCREEYPLTANERPWHEPRKTSSERSRSRARKRTGTVFHMG